MKSFTWILGLASLAVVAGAVGQTAAAQNFYVVTPEARARYGETATTPTSARPGEASYDRYMRQAYAAQKQEDYRTARVYFYNALQARPDDRLATIGYWKMTDQLMADEADADQMAASAYDRYMQVGYRATKQRDYQTALINFRRALNERPNDPYASQAVRNVTTYIQAQDQARR